MPDPIRLPVVNPSPYDRTDCVEIDLGRVARGSEIRDDDLHLYEQTTTGGLVERPFQIDYPFGPGTPRRVLTFEATNAPASKDDYSQTSVEFYLKDHGERPTVAPRVWLRYFYGPNISSDTWIKSRKVIGVMLGSADQGQNGLEVYFSLVPSPDPNSPINYAGAVTSIRHHRSHRFLSHGAVLSPYLNDAQDRSPLARWGQLTRIDLYPLPWEPRWFHVENLLPAKGGREYTLVWANAGPHHATIGVVSSPFTVRYDGRPVLPGPAVDLQCRLYRRITLHPDREYYSEQLTVVPDAHPATSLAFRAHFAAHIDVADLPKPEVARDESIPDYFAVWREWPGGVPPHETNFGYGFASDSHVRGLTVAGPALSWRLQLGHEHRCVHSFLYEPQRAYGRSHTVGHDAWYLRLFKPMEVRPLTRYVKL